MQLSNEDKRYFIKKVKQFLAIERVKQLDDYIQHGNVTCLEHSLSVAYSSFLFCRKFHIKVDTDSLIRGAFFHDFFLYDWHIYHPSHRLHGFRHPFTAYKNAKKLFHLTSVEKDIIMKHMWPLTVIPPKYKESYIVCLMDKICSLSETFHLNTFKIQISYDM